MGAVLDVRRLHPPRFARHRPIQVEGIRSTIGGISTIPAG